MMKALWRWSPVWLLLAVWPAAVLGQTRTVPENRAQIQLSFAPLVEQAAPSVVNIYTRTRVTRREGGLLFDDPFFRRFFGDMFGGRPRQRVENSLGSGVVVDSTGLIVTNRHVIEGADEITVALADRREFDAKLVLADQRTDLAVLRIEIDGETLPALELGDSDALNVGDLVLAIGNPFNVGQTVTSGIVSALSRTAVGDSNYQYFIQTDAAINPGNSGGALITMDGRLIGINTAIFSRSGGSLGIGFAIPSSMVALVLDAARRDGTITRPWLGISGQPVTADLAPQLHLARPAGVLITEVYPGSAAARADLRPGDVVREVDGREVFDPRGLNFRFATRPLGGNSRLTVVRGGDEFERVVRVEAAPEVPPRNRTTLRGDHPLDKVTVANLSPALADELSMDPMALGVVVMKMPRNGPAAYLGVRPGDIVERVNGQPVEKVADLNRILESVTRDFKLVLRRGEQLLRLRVSR